MLFMISAEDFIFYFGVYYGIHFCLCLGKDAAYARE